MSFVGEEFDINKLYAEAFGFVAKPFPALGNIGDQLTPSNPLGAVQGLADQYKNNLLGIPMIMPLEIGLPNEELFLFTTEPMISLSLKTKVIRRFPNRSVTGGSIKETWSEDDVVITIKGLIMNYTEDVYPEGEVRLLRKFKGKDVAVRNEMFRIFGIDRIFIESLEIPFTAGIRNQAYTIKAYSDKLFDGLLIEV